MDGINGSQPLSPTKPSSSKVAENSPASNHPVGAVNMTPDVDVAISELTQARMETMMSPQSGESSEAMRSNASNGGIDFGVDKGGFAWPLDTAKTNTSDGADLDSVDAWQVAKQAVNGMVVDETHASESAYIALGKSTVSSSSAQ